MREPGTSAFLACLKRSPRRQDNPKLCRPAHLSLDRKKPCPKRFFDPPPEVMKDPELQDLRDKCFTPYQIDDLQQSENPIKP